ncbi:MAG: ComF family protein [Clostridia bacterium]
MKGVLPKVWEGFLDLLYPEGIYCYLCGEKIRTHHTYGICEGCWGEFVFIGDKSCSVCGKYLHSGDLCSDCRSFRHSFDRAYSLCVYDGKVKDWIYSFKYAGRSYLARPFGRMMADGIREAGLDRKTDCIVPVPLYRKKFRQRGYNQSGLLAETIKRELDIKASSYILQRKSNTPPLSGLSRLQRLETMEGAFEVKGVRRLAVKNVLLIDDIYTTGSTVNQCARALKNGGASRVYVFTLASGKDRQG